MYCPAYGCNSDCKMTNEMCFFYFQVCKSLNKQYRKKAWVEFCKRKAFNLRQTLECSHFIRRLTHSSQGFPSLILFSFSLLAHTRMLTLLLDSRLNIFHTNDLKAIISLQNVCNLGRHCRKYIACFYSTHLAFGN